MVLVGVARALKVGAAAADGISITRDDEPRQLAQRGRAGRGGSLSSLSGGDSMSRVFALFERKVEWSLR